ncbi:MAG: UDP-N-acetylglucosamine 2-epimerase (non-hydrolyzing) [Nitrospiraceae bacterium]
MKIICVVGARPNFVKAAPLVEALHSRPWASVFLVHTGQHYDRRMSELFFEDLGLPRPHLDLQVGSGPHGEQTGQIMVRLEPVLKHERPDLVMVFGDVNSTVAAALCAAKLGIAVAHVEAGLRSFDRSMPEELNRIVTDHLSDYLFTTERSGAENLRREGVPYDKIFFVGNVMVDTLLKHRDRAAQLRMCRRFGFAPRSYGILTLHRPSNVDEPRTLAGILEAIRELAKELPILFPCHVRTRQRLNAVMSAEFSVLSSEHSVFKARRSALRTQHFTRGRVEILDPLGYLEFLSLMSDARLVLTDSGGIQEETTVLGIPCLTLRDSTERPSTIEQGSNILVGNSPARILEAACRILRGDCSLGRVPKFWDGQAAKRIVEILEDRWGIGESALQSTAGTMGERSVSDGDNSVSSEMK